MINQRRRNWIFFLFGIGLLALFGFNVGSGSIAIAPADLLRALVDDGERFHTIVWQFRLPKALTCVLAGAALGAGGLLMQTLFRNPLAGPDVLGLSSGASLAVALLLMTNPHALGWLTGPWSLATAAFVGSALVFVVVMAVARTITDNTSLLIIGLMISAAVSSMVAVLQYVSQAEDLQSFMIWSLGSVGGTQWSEIQVLAALLAAGTLILFFQVKAINGLLLGVNYAQSLGIHIGRTRFWMVTATSLLTGGVTAFCGPIAFVGLAVPHLVRLGVATTDHKTLLPLVMMGGAMLLLFCDLLAQGPGQSMVLPLNAVTSLIGAPVVIWVVVRSKKLRL